MYLLYQKTRAEQFLLDPPSTGNLWDSAADWAAALWLWGQSVEDGHIINCSGVPSRSERLERLLDGELVTHGAVVSYFMDQFTPSDPLPRMSPERGNCPPIYRVR